MCRRLIILAGIFGLTAALVGPAAADTPRTMDSNIRAVVAHRPTAEREAQIEANLRRQADILRAQGMKVEVKPVNLASSVHDHMLSVTSPSWHGNGQEYWFRLDIGIHHEVNRGGDLADRWQPGFTIGCWRTGGLTAPCNFALDLFRAESFQSSNGLSILVHGTTNPPNDQCVQEEALNGAWRTTDAVWSYNAAELEYIQARFLTSFSLCNSLHLTNVYTSRSYRTAAYPFGQFDYEDDYRDTKTGLYVK